MKLPVVFITASDDAEVERSALRAGGLRVLRKPFSSQESAGRHRFRDAGGIESRALGRHAASSYTNG